MSHSKSIIFTALFCLLFCTTELYAIEPDKSSLEKQETTFSLNSIFKSIGGAVNGMGNALDDTVNGLGNALDGSVSGLGDFIDETTNGLGNALDETWVGLGDLFEGTGEVLEEVVEVAAVAGILLLYVMSEAERQYDGGSSGYYYDNYRHDYGYRHNYEQNYRSIGW